MQRTSNADWQGTSYRQAGVYQGSGGVLRMARSRTHRRGIPILKIVLAGTLFAFMLALLGVAVVVTRLQHGEVAQAVNPYVQVSVLDTAPAVSFQGDTRPIRILLLGSDQRGDDRSYRTDVIVLVSIDPANFTASAVSFPRDLWVEPPTLYPMKINMIQAIGGFDAVAEMFETNFGVRPDYYVLTNFSGFTHLIDSLDGIDVQVSQTLSDSCDLPQASSGICTIEPGNAHMDGPTALWYARSRHSSSDFDRLRRAQEVLQAVFMRTISLDALKNLPKYYHDFSQDLETNITLGEISRLVPIAVRIFQEPERIHHYAIDENQATPSWSWDGMWILLPDTDAIRSLLEEAGIR